MTSTPTIGPRPPRVRQPDDLSHLGLPCREPGVDPDAVFFPNSGGKGGGNQARELCARCPISVPCREFAIANNEQHGIWGGRTREERKAIRRTRRAWGQDPEAGAA